MGAHQTFAIKMNHKATALKETEEIKSKRSSTVTLWITVIAAYVWMALTMSASGHTSLMSSVGLIPAFAYACYAFFTLPRKGRLEQILGSVAFTLVALMMIKNIVDVISSWHELVYQ